MRVFEVARKAELPELPLAKTQKRTMGTNLLRSVLTQTKNDYPFILV
jgi:hypothetical protein